MTFTVYPAVHHLLLEPVRTDPCVAVAAVAGLSSVGCSRARQQDAKRPVSDCSAGRRAGVLHFRPYYSTTVQPRNVRTGNVPLRVTVRFFYSYKT